MVFPEQMRKRVEVVRECSGCLTGLTWIQNCKVIVWKNKVGETTQVPQFTLVDEEGDVTL